MKKNPVLFLTGLSFTLLYLSLVADVCAENGQATSADSYVQKYAHTVYRLIHLPSGATFKIKTLGRKEFYSLLNKRTISMSEYNAIIKRFPDELTLRERETYMPFFNVLIVTSVVDPGMCLDDEEGKLPVRMLTPDDFDYVIEEIAPRQGGLSKDRAKTPVKLGLNKADTNLSITRLILDPEEYELKSIAVKGVVTGLMPEIVISGGERKVILQRFYLSDSRNSILVFWFCKEGQRLRLRAGTIEKIVSDYKDGDPRKVNIRRGKFTTKLIPQPVILGHSDNLHSIRKAWMQKIHETVDDYQ